MSKNISIKTFISIANRGDLDECLNIIKNTGNIRFKKLLMMRFDDIFRGYVDIQKIILKALLYDNKNRPVLYYDFNEIFIIRKIFSDILTYDNPSDRELIEIILWCSYNTYEKDDFIKLDEDGEIMIWSEKNSFKEGSWVIEHFPHQNVPERTLKYNTLENLHLISRVMYNKYGSDNKYINIHGDIIYKKSRFDIYNN